MNNIDRIELDIELLHRELDMEFHRESFQPVLEELHLGIHKRKFKPVLEELTAQLSNTVALEHSAIHFDHIIREDPTDVTQLDPSDLQAYLSEPANHLSMWETGSDTRFYGGGMDEFTCSQWAAHRLDELKPRLGYDWSRDTLILNEERDPEGCRTGSLQTEPYFCPDAEIPFFVDMVESFADVFGTLSLGNLCFLVNLIQIDPHGVLF